MAISVLVINCGSSSIKYALISERREDRIYGLAENLGAADARIKGRIGQVDQQVHDKDGQRGDHDRRQHHVEIALQDGVDHQLADTGKAKDRLDHHGAVQ